MQAVRGPWLSRAPGRAPRDSRNAPLAAGQPSSGKPSPGGKIRKKIILKLTVLEFLTQICDEESESSCTL